jgi:hypothetical protein
MLRVCNDGENTTSPAGVTICRTNTLGRKTVKLVPHNWASAKSNVLIAQILMMEQLQTPVEIMQYYGTYTNYYVHNGGDPPSPEQGYSWGTLDVASSNPDCTGYSSFLDLPTGSGQANACGHAMLEIWSGQATNRADYVTTRGTVEDGGILGTIGSLGLYITRSLLTSNPELGTFRGFTSRVSLRWLEPATALKPRSVERPA